MASRWAPLFLALAVCGCGRQVIFCQGPVLGSPDGECTAQVVQDVATDGSYATLECNDLAWHREGTPEWNVVVARGAQAPIELKWVGERRLEAVVNAGTRIETHKTTIRGDKYSVEVSLRELPVGERALQGCGLDP